MSVICWAAFLPAVEGGRDDALLDEPAVTATHREHWSFAPLERPEPPDVVHIDWPRNAIDRFMLAKLEAAGLSPMPEADRLTLLRRVTFDLTGLPPTPEEIEQFASDDAPDAYERLVDRLLASPAYGERWAQHWLDLARFAETDGYEFDKPRPEAWRYRDWVIGALNADMPWDEFVRMQIAGDELRPDDPAAAAATWFLLCGPDMPDINRQDERRHTFLNDMTGTVGSALLGLQIGCAQCHDHKWDPISQADFYRFRAIFDPALAFEKNKSVSELAERPDPSPSRLMIRGDFRRPGPEIAPGFPRIANPWDDSIPPTPTAAKTTRRRTALAEWLTRPDHPLATRVIVNRLWQFHFGEGLSRSPSDFGLMGDGPTHPELLDWLATEFANGRDSGVKSQEPDSDRKLPERVTTHHSPLTTNNGPRTTDQRGWSLKRMHRLMVTSATYRQASRPVHPGWSDEQAARAVESWNQATEADPDNRLLSRMSRRRLEGEAIRDAMLTAAGTLSQRRGGPGVRPPLPPELVRTLLKDQWTVTHQVEDHHRRSIYLFVRRNLRYPLFEVFDKPDTNASCPQRSRSTIAPQALALLNSELSLSAARELAGRLHREAGPNRERQIELAFLRTLQRRPSETENEQARRFLTENAELLRTEDVEVTALTDLCLALFNLNEFIYID